MRDATFSPGGLLGGYPGVLRHLAVPAPVAGAEWAFTLPSAGSWRLRCIHALLTTSATVAVRQPGISLTDGSLLWWRAQAAVGVAASTAADVGALTGTALSQAAGVSGSVILPLPDVVLPPGYTVGSATAALQAADAYTAIVITAEEIDAYAGQIHPDQMHLHGASPHHR